MHILFLLTQDLESPSGLGRYLPIAKEIMRMGHKVTIAALHSNFHSLRTHREDREGVEVLYVAQMHVLKQANQKHYFPLYKFILLAVRATLALGWVALKSPADIIHVGKPHPMNGLAGLLGKYLRGKTLLVDCDDFEAGSSRFSTEWQKQTVSFFERWVPQHAAVVTTNTHFMQDKLICWGIPPDRVLYLPNGVDSQRFSQPDQKELDALKARLGLTDNKVVAYIGSLSLPSHPVDLLVEAFGKVHASLPEAALMLVGGGEDYETLKGHVQHLGIESAVRFCGRVPPDEVSRYYQIAHVSVDPVRDDDAARGRSPLKLFESWAACVPFVSADVGDRRSLLGTPPAGLLAAPGDPDSLAGCILKVLQDSRLSEELRRRGAQCAETYSWGSLTRQLESTYRQILS